MHGAERIGVELKGLEWRVATVEWVRVEWSGADKSGVRWNGGGGGGSGVQWDRVEWNGAGAPAGVFEERTQLCYTDIAHRRAVACHFYRMRGYLIRLAVPSSTGFHCASSAICLFCGLRAGKGGVSSIDCEAGYCKGTITVSAFACTHS